MLNRFPAYHAAAGGLVVAQLCVDLYRAARVTVSPVQLVNTVNRPAGLASRPSNPPHRVYNTAVLKLILSTTLNELN